jgi:DNA-binding MarR family transcriptional regulator
MSNDFFDQISQSEYSQKDVDDKILLNLRDLGLKIPSLYAGKDSQRRTLILLRLTGSISQREITEKLNLKSGSMSEVLTKLENKGLIERTLNKDDKRTSIISLTEKGIEKANEAFEFRRERRTKMFSFLDDIEKDTLLNLLEKINTV